MNTQMRPSGIGVVGDIPWGTHFCQFYETKEDLLETLLPYFRSGLQNNELCVWVVSEPFSEPEVRDALSREVPGFEEHLARGDIEILHARDWYLDNGSLELGRVTTAWREKHDKAARKGYQGIRVSGNTAWLENQHWGEYCDYERELNSSVLGQRMAILCTYPLSRCGAAEILEVTRNHQFALTRRHGAWEIVESSAAMTETREAIKQLNNELEVRVQERTAQLTAANEELKREVVERMRAEEEVERLRRKLELENAYLNEQVKENLAFGEILGKSPALLEVLRQIEKVAPTNAAVLVSGESGTGKELAARAIHDSSPRREHAMVTVNCASVPRELFESEFFGHVKGAFTGALRDRIGRFQMAHQGTIFLDEIGEIPLELQSKLLRVLQDGQIERVGEDQMRKVDVRVIAATNRDLRREVDAGRFRRDLYYRLCVFPIHLPRLTERREDIALLAVHFLKLAARRLGTPEVRMTQEALTLLRNYEWPGNVRELHHVIERAVILSQRGPLRVDLVLGESPSSMFPPGSGAVASLGTPDGDAFGVRRRASDRAILSPEDLRKQQRNNLLAALEKSDWKIYGIGGAAEILGLKPTTLASRLKRYGIHRPEVKIHSGNESSFEHEIMS